MPLQKKSMGEWWGSEIWAVIGVKDYWKNTPSVEKASRAQPRCHSQCLVPIGIIWSSHQFSNPSHTDFNHCNPLSLQHLVSLHKQENCASAFYLETTSSWTLPHHENTTHLLALYSLQAFMAGICNMSLQIFLSVDRNWSRGRELLQSKYIKCQQLLRCLGGRAETPVDFKNGHHMSLTSNPVSRFLLWIAQLLLCGVSSSSYMGLREN